MIDDAALAGLEAELAPLSHGTAAKKAVLKFLRKLGKGQARQQFMADYMLRPPLQYEKLRDRFPGEEFNVLQGDIIRTREAYILGARQFKNFYYVVATSTCDLVRDRRDTATLLLLEPRFEGNYASQADYNQELGDLLGLRSTRYIYIPPLDSSDQEGVLFNVAHLDRVAQSTNAAVNDAERIASMTLIGWRLFGALLRNIQVREGAQEAAMRLS